MGNYAAVKRWRERNPDEARRIDRVYKKLKRSTPFKLMWPHIRRAYGDACLRCGKAEERLSADHVVPLYHGGTNDVFNLQPLCRSCNKIKGRRMWLDYRSDQGEAIQMIATGFQSELDSYRIASDLWHRKRDLAATARARRKLALG